MINIFKKDKKPQDFQKLFKPSPDFVRRTGFLFLSAFSQKFGRDFKPAPSAFRYFVRGLASGVALMFIISSGAAYADQQNVGPDNLLYPLKRAQEVVNLTLSSAEEKPVLHLKLAERRLEEIEEVTQKDPSSDKIPHLSSDLRKELRNSIGALNGDEVEEDEIQEDDIAGVGSGGASIQKLDKNKEDSKEEEKPEETLSTETPGGAGSPATSAQGPIQAPQRSLLKKQVFTEKSAPSICASFRTLINSQNSRVQEAIDENSELLEKFEKKCFPILREIQKPFINEAPGDLRQESRVDDQTKYNQSEQEIQKVELENKNSSND